MEPQLASHSSPPHWQHLKTDTQCLVSVWWLMQHILQRAENNLNVGAHGNRNDCCCHVRQDAVTYDTHSNWIAANYNREERVKLCIGGMIHESSFTVARSFACLVPTSFTHPTTECFLRLSTVGFKRGAGTQREWEAGEAHALSLSPQSGSKAGVESLQSVGGKKGGKKSFSSTFWRTFAADWGVVLMRGSWRKERLEENLLWLPMSCALMNHLYSSNPSRLCGLYGHWSLQIGSSVRARLYFPVEILLSREAPSESKLNDGQCTCPAFVIQSYWDMNTESKQLVCFPQYHHSIMQKAAACYWFLSFFFPLMSQYMQERVT